MESFATLERRTGWQFRYTLTYIDSNTVALLEIDQGTDKNSRREPTRRLCIADASHIGELQDKCDDWNEENASDFERWKDKNVIPYL